MPTRLVIDGTFTDTIRYYEAFPTEPTVKPDGNLDVLVPVARADRLSPMTLLTLMRRLKDIPGDEKRVLISCHGNPEGLAIPVVPGGNQLADRFNLHILFILAITKNRIDKVIKSLPPEKQAAEWQRVLRDMKFLDGKDMFPQPMPALSPAVFQQLFDWFFKRTGGGAAPFPPIDDVQVVTPPPPSGTVKVSFTMSFKKSPPSRPLFSSAKAADVQSALEALPTVGAGNISVTGADGGPWTCTFIKALGGKAQPLITISGGGSVAQKDRLEEQGFQIKVVTRTPAELEELVTLRNQMFGRFDRLEFRSCNTGKDGTVAGSALFKMRAFFGCREVCAPDVVAFEIDMKIVVDRAFDRDFNGHVEAATSAALGRPKGRKGPATQPVMIDQATNREVPVPRSGIPMTRRFDGDKARKGDEVFIRLWLVKVRPHKFFGWLRTIEPRHVEQFAKDKIDADISRWTTRTSLPMAGLWLVNDFNVLMPAVPPLNPGPSTGTPLNGPGLAAPPPPPLPAFALARDPEYRQHLICVP